MSAKRVLVVDDERATTTLLKSRLEKAGTYEVRTENSGEAGLRAAREFKPDLILLDVMMPDLDGDEVAGQLRQDPNTSGIPIVFLTAIVTQEDVGEGDGIIGGNRFLAKPVDPEKVIDCVDEILS